MSNVIEKLHEIFKIQQGQKSFISIESIDDVYSVSSALANIVNAHPKFALLFILDPEQFCSDFGIRLSKEVLQHIKRSDFLNIDHQQSIKNC